MKAYAAHETLLTFVYFDFTRFLFPMRDILFFIQDGRPAPVNDETAMN